MKIKGLRWYIISLIALATIINTFTVSVSKLSEVKSTMSILTHPSKLVATAKDTPMFRINFLILLFFYMI